MKNRLRRALELLTEVQGGLGRSDSRLAYVTLARESLKRAHGMSGAGADAAGVTAGAEGLVEAYQELEK